MIAMIKVKLPTVAFLIILLLSACGDKSSDDIGGLKRRGLTALEEQRFNDALNSFRAALRQQPSDRDLLYYAGLSFRKMDMPDSAVSYFGRARVLFPRDREINRQLLELCPMLDNYNCALQAIATLISTGDNERMYWPQLADLNYLNGEMSLAVRYYRLLLADDNTHIKYYMNLWQALMELGKPLEAVKVLEEALDRFGPSISLLGNLAVNYIRLNNFYKAENYLRQGLEIAPNSVPAWINLAHVLTEFDDRDKKEEALEIYKKYREAAPPMYNLDSIITALEEELSGR